MKYKYQKYVPSLADDLDMDELMSKLSDLLLSSGFGNPWGDPSDNDDRTMQALHDAILEALFSGGVLPPDVLEKLFGDPADGDQESMRQQLEELIQQIIDQMKESGYITPSPDLEAERQHRAQGGGTGEDSEPVTFEVTDKALDFLGFKALRDLLGSLGHSSAGRHDTRDLATGTSGTILSIGTVATAVDRGSVPTETRNLRVSAKSIRRFRKLATTLDLEERLHLPGLDPRRADLTVAGAVLLDTLLQRLKADEITLCDLALREGLVLDYIHQHRSEIARVDRYPDVRRRSTIELAERCNWEAEHSRQVTRLALGLFDRTVTIHGLGDREREWLEYASLLHDIGNHISYEKHHRHSYYLVKHGDLRGFEPEEIEVIALVTRYHRRALPARTHIGMTDLPRKLQRAVRTLSAFLRLAESLDRSRNGVVKKVDVRERAGTVRVDVFGVGDIELEVWAATRQLPALEQALKRQAKIASHHVEEDEPAKPRAKRRVA